jgi:hypothetical protein
VLVRVGPYKKWSTRPRLVRDEADLQLLREAGQAIENAGWGVPKAVLFQGQPTMDLVVPADDPRATADHLRRLLQELPVEVAALGRAGDLSYVRYMWRHM